MSLRTVSLGLAVAVVLAACGGAAAPSTPDSVAPTPAPTAVPTAAPTPAPTAVPTEAPGAGAPSVAIIDNAFSPASLTVAVGTTVTWTNTGNRNHTVSTADSSFGSTGALASGATFTHTFDVAGTFDYFCAIHSGMKGTITVTP